MKWIYLLVDFFTVLLPFIFSFHPRINFHRYFKTFLLSNIAVSLVFIAWDILFTRLGIWGFNPDYVAGIYFFNLPLEEILFFTCIPFSCVFTYHCLNLFYKIHWKSKTENRFVLVVSFLLFITGIIFHDKLYTSSVFISLPVVLVVMNYFIKINWLAKLVLIYPVLLIPFFIVNGILTGSGLQHPVVWYNDAENLGLRLLTIPVEDVFYGFELILLNVFFYEYLKNKSAVLENENDKH